MTDDTQTTLLSEPADGGLWIKGLKLENFAGLKELELDLGALTVLAGANASGKTSVIESVKAALSRGGFTDDMIRVDAEKGTVTVELTGGLEVKAQRTRGKNPTVKVTQGGIPMPSPRALLDGLLDPVSLDPVAWLDGDRTQALLDAMPLRVNPADVSILYQTACVPPEHRMSKRDEAWFRRHALVVLSDLEKDMVARRRAANAEVKQLSAWVDREREQLADITDPTDEIERVSAELTAAGAQLEAADKQGEDHRRAEELVQQAQDRVYAKQERIDEIEQQLAIAREELAMLETDLKDAQHRLKKTPEPAADLGEFESRVADLSSTLGDLKERRGRYHEALEQRGRVDSEADRLDKIREVATALDNGVKAFRAAPAKLLSEAELPVDGLEYADGALTLHGVPVSQLSGAETVRLAAKVAIHRVKQQRGQFVLLDGLEQLDDDQRAALLDEVRGSGTQWILTEVGQRGDVPDGTVVVMGGSK